MKNYFQEGVENYITRSREFNLKFVRGGNCEIVKNKSSRRVASGFSCSIGVLWRGVVSKDGAEVFTIGFWAKFGGLKKEKYYLYKICSETEAFIRNGNRRLVTL